MTTADSHATTDAQTASDTLRTPRGPRLLYTSKGGVNLERLEYYEVRSSASVTLFFAERKLTLEGRDANAFLWVVADRRAERRHPIEDVSL